MFKKHFILSLALFMSLLRNLAAQTELENMERKMAALVDSIVRLELPAQKNRLNEQLLVLFDQSLELEGAFSYPFSNLKNIGSLFSADGKIRLITWNVPQVAGTQRFFGYLVVNSPGGIRKYRLTDSRAEISNPQLDIVDTHKWYGALYYYIHGQQAGGRTLYTLLGVDMNNSFSTRRVIEVLWFNDRGEPQFGAPVFRVKNSTLNRVIFEYSSRASMMLRYSAELGMIVFDHLSPQRPDMAGNYQFYGPDFSYDGFKLENGVWVYVADIDLRNTKQQTPKAPVTPPEKNPEPGFLYKPNAVNPEKTR